MAGITKRSGLHQPPGNGRWLSSGQWSQL